jgi:hypothetical protein
MLKNVAGQFITVFAYDSLADGQPPKTGNAANITGNVSIDGGSVTALADTSAAEIDSVARPGYYRLSLTQAETNGDVLEFGANSSTFGIICICVPAVVYPVTESAAFDATDGDRLLLVQGDDHTEGDRLPTLTITGYTGPDLAGATGKLRLLRLSNYNRFGSDADADLEVSATVLQVGTTLTVTAPITAEQSATLYSNPPAQADTHQYQVIATTATGKRHTLQFGPTRVTRSIDPVD